MQSLPTRVQNVYWLAAGALAWERGREKSTKEGSPLPFPFFPIPYPFDARSPYWSPPFRLRLPCRSMSCKKNMEYREIATKMFFFFYKKTNIKLLGNYLQKNSKGYSLSTIRINNIRRWCSKFISRNHKKRFEIHCDQIESWSRENLKFVFVFSVIGRNCTGNVSKRRGIILCWDHMLVLIAFRENVDISLTESLLCFSPKISTVHSP